jgi:hypothetical protein
VERAKSRGIRTVVGYFIPTAKNAMVRNFYSGLGFTAAAPNPALDFPLPEGSTVWELDLASYARQNTHIKVLEFANA